MRSCRLLLLTLWLACGCKHVEPADKGIRIGDKTLEQFQPNNTSETWLVAIIGPPTTRTLVPGMDGHVEILRYSVIERPPQGFFALFTGSPVPRTTATIYFVVRDGMVTQFWADREAKPTLTGKKENDTGEKTGA